MKDLQGKTIAANYFRGREAVGGRLTFDNVGMTFTSHALNVHRGETRILYRDVVRMEKTNTKLRFLNIPNGLSVFTSDGTEHKFVVNIRDDMMAFIEEKK